MLANAEEREVVGDQPFQELNRFGDLIDFLIGRPAAAVNDTETHGARGLGLPRALDQLLFGHEWITIDRRMRHRGLGTVVAIFRTEAAFGVLQDVNLDTLAVIMTPYSEGGAQKLG